MTFSVDNPQVRFRSQTEQISSTDRRSQNSIDIQGKEKTSFVSFNDVALKRYDSFEEEIQLKESKALDAEKLAQIRNSAEETNGSEPVQEEMPRK